MERQSKREDEKLSTEAGQLQFLPDEKTDTVIDWVAIDRTLIDDDKNDAYLVAAAVQAILDHRRAPDYWAVSKLWKDRQLEEVVALSEQRAHAILAAIPGAAAP
jgi:hypothetical protein